MHLMLCRSLNTSETILKQVITAIIIEFASSLLYIQQNMSKIPIFLFKFTNKFSCSKHTNFSYHRKPQLLIQRDQFHKFQAILIYQFNMFYATQPLNLKKQCNSRLKHKFIAQPIIKNEIQHEIDKFSFLPLNFYS